MKSVWNIQITIEIIVHFLMVYVPATQWRDEFQGSGGFFHRHILERKYECVDVNWVA